MLGARVKHCEEYADSVICGVYARCREVNMYKLRLAPAPSCYCVYGLYTVAPLRFWSLLALYNFQYLRELSAFDESMVTPAGDCNPQAQMGPGYISASYTALPHPITSLDRHLRWHGTSRRRAHCISTSRVRAGERAFSYRRK